MEKAKALFVGMVTWDVVYLAERTPGANEKMMAQEMTLSAGGPAGNAAVTFAALGGRAALVATCGATSIAGLVKADLSARQVKLLDLDADRLESPPVSSIIVSSKTASRAVMSVNAPKPSNHAEDFWDGLWDGVDFVPDVILADGHQVTAAVRALEKFPDSALVLDCGSWREGFKELIPRADFAICSGHFVPPGCGNTEGVIDFVDGLGAKHVAVSHGAGAIEYLSGGKRGSIEVAPRKVVDTMGAGDVLHGAFCRFCSSDEFQVALSKAAGIASFSCGFFGTRSWPEQWSLTEGGL